MIAHLTRYETGDEGTFGQLRLTDKKGAQIYSCSTLELPWRDNVRAKSCIPAGVYTFRWRTDSPAHGEVYEAVVVPARTNIQIHPANLAGDEDKGWVKQLDGCIALGATIMKFLAGHKPAGDKDQRGVSMSKATVHEFVGLTKKEEITVEISWAIVPSPEEKTA